MVDEIDKVLGDEKVVWKGQPQLKPLIASGFIGTFIGGIILAISLLFIIIPLRAAYAAQAGSVIMSLVIGFVVIPFLVALFGLYLFLTPLWTYIWYDRLWYALSGKRIAIQSGIVGRDFQFFDLDQVMTATARVGVLDKLFGANAGTIRVDVRAVSLLGNGTTTKSYLLSHVSDPYAVLKLIKNAQYKTKADIQFPAKSPA